MAPMVMMALIQLGIKAGAALSSVANKKIQAKNAAAGKPQGAASQALFGTESGNQQFQNYTPEQMELMNNLGQLGNQGIQDLLSQGKHGFQPIEDKARMDFNQTTIPGIAERFSNLGAQRSSAFGQTLGAAGAGLESDLAALGSQYNLNQQDFYKNLLELGLKPQFENAFIGGQTGLANEIGGGKFNIKDLMGMFGKKDKAIKGGLDPIQEDAFMPTTAYPQQSLGSIGKDPSFINNSQVNSILGR